MEHIWLNSSYILLLSDLELILKNSPKLVREMINIVGQLMYFAKHGRGNKF